MIPEEKPVDWRETGAPPPKSDNLPPSIAELAVEDLRTALERFKDRRDEFVKSATTQIVKDRHDVGAAGDTIKLGKRVWEMIERERTDRSEPHRDAQLALKAFADEFWSPAYDALTVLNEQIRAFNAAEKKRVEDQRAEQAAAMAAMREKVAAPPMPVDVLPARRKKTRGDLGATVSIVDKVEYTVTDVRAVPDVILNSETVKAAIIAVAKSMSKHMPVIDGITKTVVEDHRIS